MDENNYVQNCNYDYCEDNDYNCHKCYLEHHKKPIEIDQSEWDLSLVRALREKNWYLEGDGNFAYLLDSSNNLLYKTIMLPGWRDRLENYLIEGI